MPQLSNRADFLATGLVSVTGPFDEKCPTCFEPQTDPVKLPCDCKYVHCRECMTAWLTQETTFGCPTCRTDFIARPMTLTEFLDSDQAPDEDFNLRMNPEMRAESDAFHQRYSDYLQETGPFQNSVEALYIFHPEPNDFVFINTNVLTYSIRYAGNIAFGIVHFSRRRVHESDLPDLDYLLYGLQTVVNWEEGQVFRYGELRGHILHCLNEFVSAADPEDVVPYSEMVFETMLSNRPGRHGNVQYVLDSVVDYVCKVARGLQIDQDRTENTQTEQEKEEENVHMADLY